jgi:predicted nucleic acid-binding protein
MSADRITLDTNILVYSVDSRAGLRREIARQVIELAIGRDCRLTLQAVSEFYAAVTRKNLMPRADAAAQAADWLELFPSLSASASAARIALAVASSGRASYWDMLLLATAAEGECGAVLTEDMADGAVIEGVLIVNPFGGATLSAGAARLLGAEP